MASQGAPTARRRHVVGPARCGYGGGVHPPAPPAIRRRSGLPRDVYVLALIAFLVAVGFGPVLAGIFCNMTGSWWPIVAMLVAYSVIGLVSAILMPEVRDRDLSLANDAADTLPLRKDEKSGQYI